MNELFLYQIEVDLHGFFMQMVRCLGLLKPGFHNRSRNDRYDHIETTLAIVAIVVTDYGNQALVKTNVFW